MSVQEIIAAVDALSAEERHEVYAALMRKGLADIKAHPSAPERLEDPLYGLGSNPVQCDVPDAAEAHDRYLYGPDA